jgi:chaperone required for assembly of F1-ATPase
MNNGNDSDNGDTGRRREPHRPPANAPARIISDSLAKPLARRFYKDVSVGGTRPYHILLDGRPVKTPKKRALALPTSALAEAVAEEWRRQQSKIDPRRMPLTRFANTAIDAVSDSLDAVAGDIVAYVGSDLLCYRAETPEELARLQAEHWDPILAWAEKALGTQFKVVTGVVHVRQPEAALAAVAAALIPHDAFRLTGLHVLTTLTGSGLLTLAVARGVIGADAAWTAAHVDEDYQISLWGEDAEAAARRRGRREEFDAAYCWLTLLAS